MYNADFSNLSSFTQSHPSKQKFQCSNETTYKNGYTVPNSFSSSSSSSMPSRTRILTWILRSQPAPYTPPPFCPAPHTLASVLITIYFPSHHSHVAVYIPTTSILIPLLTRRSISWLSIPNHRKVPPSVATSQTPNWYNMNVVCVPSQYGRISCPLSNPYIPPELQPSLISLYSKRFLLVLLHQ